MRVGLQSHLLKLLLLYLAMYEQRCDVALGRGEVEVLCLGDLKFCCSPSQSVSFLALALILGRGLELK